MVVVVWTAFGLAASGASAAAETPVNREILGLYNSAEEGLYEESRLHRWLEMPLNHLGYKVTPYDVSKGLPPDATTRRFHAIVTWFGSQLPNASDYLKWAARTAKGGKRFVVLDSVGAAAETNNLPLINSFLKELGLAYVDFYVGDTKQTKILSMNQTMIGLEQQLDPSRLPGHQVITQQSRQLRVHLSVADPAHQWAKAEQSVLVATGPRGGFATTSYAGTYNVTTERFSWIIDPFRFLEEALKPRLWPIPDTTTISGRRLYFSHVDGDGWNNLTKVEPYAAERAVAAEVMLDALIAPFPDLPVSIGLIAGDADPRMGAPAIASEIAQSIYALPHVEIATHTYTHPYDWSYFTKYDRAKEMADVLAFSAQPNGYDDQTLDLLIDEWRTSGKGVAPTNAALNNRPVPLPRAKPHAPFDLTLEVAGALEFTNTFSNTQKVSQVYLWSGNTRPFEEAVKQTRAAGVRNINGGDSRFDRVYPSVAYVAPLSRMVGSERQIYAVNSNENTYTDGWTGPYDGFKLLKETFENTESPRRLKGMNIYYHAFSATQPLGVEAVVEHLNRARASEIAPIAASHYAAIADGFFDTVVSEIAPLKWRVKNRGHLQTFRFDDDGDVEVDYAASVGVIGSRRHNGSIYLALDQSVAQPVIAMRATAAKQRKPVARPYLVQSRWHISEVKISACSVAAKVSGFGHGEMSWGGMKPGPYTIKARSEGYDVATATAVVGVDGIATFKIDAAAIEPLDLQIACAT
jgi:polysaccharide biosynthesis protein PelA